MAESTSQPDGTRLHRPKRVAVVNGSVALLEWLEPILEPGDYDVQFLDAAESPYAQIRVDQPDLVVLTLAVEDLDSFRLLSMLKIDQDTSRIPILTYSTAHEGRPQGQMLGEPSDDQYPASKPARSFN
jgi:PleD family two-component response regulator